MKWRNILYIVLAIVYLAIFIPSIQEYSILASEPVSAASPDVQHGSKVYVDITNFSQPIPVEGNDELQRCIIRDAAGSTYLAELSPDTCEKIRSSLPEAYRVVFFAQKFANDQVKQEALSAHGGEIAQCSDFVMTPYHARPSISPWILVLGGVLGLVVILRAFTKSLKKPTSAPKNSLG